MLLALVLKFESHRADIFTLFAKMQKKMDQLLRAPTSAGGYTSTRVDEGGKCWLLLAMKMKARTVVGRGG